MMFFVGMITGSALGVLLMCIIVSGKENDNA